MTGVRGRLRPCATLLALAVTMTWGCQNSPSGSAPAFEIRDSMGVSIVDNYAPELPAGSWDVTDETVHCTGAGPRGDVRVHQVADVAPVGVDSVAVPVRSSQIILICSEGSVVAAFGGEGDGPGEYRSIAGVLPAGEDSLTVVESRRVTIVDRVTGRGRTLNLAEVANGSGRRFQRGDHTVTVIGPAVEGGGSESPGLTHMFLLDPRGTESSTVPSVPWDGALGMHTVVLFLWGGGAPWTMNPAGYWLASQDTSEFRLFDESGVVFSARSPYPRIQMTEQMWEMGADHFREDVQLDPPLSDEMIDRMVAPPDDVSDVYAPAAVRILVDSEGRPWIRLPEEEPGQEPQRWRVYSSQGRWLTDVLLPANFYARTITDDGIFGVARDDLGIESVVSYRLIRGGD